MLIKQLLFSYKNNIISIRGHPLSTYAEFSQNTSVRVSGGKKFQFSGKFSVLIEWINPNRITSNPANLKTDFPVIFYFFQRRICFFYIQKWKDERLRWSFLRKQLRVFSRSLFSQKALYQMFNLCLNIPLNTSQYILTYHSYPIRSQCTNMVFLCFQGVEKGCIGNK